MKQYTGNVQTFTAPSATTYKLEVWGAQGGGASSYGGKGGYACGYKIEEGNANLYICIGEQGKKNPNSYSFLSNSGGYNGGGNGQTGGGGATHIATYNRGILANYRSFQDEVLMVAGGGGAGDNYQYGGSGGGLSGDSGTAGMGYGGSQTAGGEGYQSGSFGRGGDAPNDLEDSCGAGGAGWYGGGGGTNSYGCGGGGSGHINSTYISNGFMENAVREGNGYALITWMPVL